MREIKNYFQSRVRTESYSFKKSFNNDGPVGKQSLITCVSITNFLFTKELSKSLMRIRLGN